MAAEDNLVSGDGNVADFAATDAGQNYVANQSAYDVADNGAVTSQNGVATASQPSWLTSTQNLLGLAGNAAKVVNGFVGTNQQGTSAPDKPNTKPNSGAAVTAAPAKSNTTMWIIAGVVAAIGLVAAVIFATKK